MGPQEMSVSSMQWQPALIKLTTLDPNVPPGEAGSCFIAPQLIIGIARATVQFNNTQNPEEKRPFSYGTYVSISPHMGYWVTESTEVVAMLRDRALGHEPPKPAHYRTVEGAKPA